MKKLTILLCLSLLLGLPCTAYAAWWNPLSWGKKAVTETVEVVPEVGKVSIGLLQTVLVWVDQVFHWTWDNLHNKLVHPTVRIITFGAVDLEPTPDA